MLDLNNIPTSDEDLNRTLASIPYTAHLGIRAELRGNEITCRLPFDQTIVGNSFGRSIHGGVIGSLLETTAILQVAFEVGSSALPKPVDITIDYLRGGRGVDTYARARIMKRGRRAINVYGTAWQTDKDRPIAAVHGHFLVQPSEQSA